MKKLESIKIGGAVYVRNESAIVESLFKPIEGKTAAGMFKVLKGRTLFYDAAGNLFAALINNKYGEKFFVSARRMDDGKVFYMAGLADHARKKLDLPESYIAENDIAEELAGWIYN